MDANGVLATLAGEDTVVVGTGTDEIRFVMDEARFQVGRDISPADDLSFGIQSLSMNVVGDAAFVYVDMTFRGSAESPTTRS